MARSSALLLFGVLATGTSLWPANFEGQDAAGDTKVDFTQWLQKKTYERFDYALDGELKTHQLIQFGELAPRETGCVLPVRTISFDVDDRSHVEGDAELSLFLECSNPHLVANILKFVGDSDRQHVEAKIFGDGLAYPENPLEGMPLPDLHYTAKLKRGFLAVLGTKVTVSVTERKVGVPPSTGADATRSRTYEIYSKIDMRFSVMGIAMKKTRFSSHMVVDPITGPVEEILEHDDGARTVIRAVSPPDD